MTDHTHQVATSKEDADLAPPPDELNPALIDAKHTFIITFIGIALFVGAVFVFVI